MMTDVQWPLWSFLVAFGLHYYLNSACSGTEMKIVGEIPKKNPIQATIPPKILSTG
jgi:hypothetical protein